MSRSAYNLMLKGAGRAVLERAAGLCSIAVSTALLKLWNPPVAPPITIALAAFALALLQPGLGHAATLAYVFCRLALSGGIWLTLALLILPVAVISVRQWVQSALWLAALSTLNAEVASGVAVAAMFLSLRYSTPSTAAALAALYVVSAGIRLSASLPPGGLGSGGFVVARGFAASDSPFESVYHWFRANLLGPPYLLFESAIYAVGGAAAAKLNAADGGKRSLAAVAPVAAALLAHYSIAAKLGLSVDPLPAAAALATALAGCAQHVPTLRLGRERARRPPPQPPPLLQHLERAWTALLTLLRRGERVILVFGPRGCGKTLLIAEACAASGLELTRDGDVRGRVVHVENAESVARLGEYVVNALRRGARCVILETARPLALAQKLGGLRVDKAIYVPPPDREARTRILALLLGGVLERSQLEKLAEATEGYSLKALMHLAERLRERPGNALEVVEELRRDPRAPTLAVEELIDLERFMLLFKGLMAGFA